MADTRSAETYTFGESVGFADFEPLPKGRIGRHVMISEIDSIGNSEVSIMSISGLTIPSSREVEVAVEFAAMNDDGTSQAGVRLYQGGTLLNARRFSTGASGAQHGIYMTALATQGAGVFTFECRVIRVGSGTISVVESGYPGNYGMLTVEDKGQTF